METKLIEELAAKLVAEMDPETGWLAESLSPETTIEKLAARPDLGARWEFLGGLKVVSEEHDPDLRLVTKAGDISCRLTLKEGSQLWKAATEVLRLITVPELQWVRRDTLVLTKLSRPFWDEGGPFQGLLPARLRSVSSWRGYITGATFEAADGGVVGFRPIAGKLFIDRPGLRASVMVRIDWRDAFFEILRQEGGNGKDDHGLRRRQEDNATGRHQGQ